MSDENDIITETTKALGLGPAAHEFYKDALQPACREIGPSLQTVAKAVSIAMLPLKGAVLSYEQIHEWLAVKITEKLAHEDPKRITAPKMSIAGPALLNLHFCKDEKELREMYATLLASSMTEGRAGEVHPTFAHIIQQLSPDEAKIISWIKANIGDFIVLREKYCEETGEQFETSFIHELFHEICTKAGLPDSGEYQFCLDNLLRLKLLDQVIYAEGKYVPETHYRHGTEPPSVLNIEEKQIHVTSLGRRFMDTCVSTHHARGS